MLKERILSAIVGITLFALFIFMGSLPFFIVVTLLIVLGIREYHRLLPEEIRVNLLLLIFLSLFYTGYAYLNNINLISIPASLIIMLILLVFFIYHLTFFHYQDIILRIAVNFIGLIYIAGGMSFFFFLRDFTTAPFDQTRALWFVLLATWATDTGAYTFGRILGRHKIAPLVSPNKTIEGALGGIVFTVVVVYLLSLAVGLNSPYILLYGALTAVIAILGDLFESALKRDAGIKDSGRIIPGHGGILDRFDSLLFTMPFTYYFLNFLLQ